MADVPRFDEAIADALRRGVVLPDVFYGDTIGRVRAGAFTVSGLASLDQVQAIYDSLLTALKEGQSFGQWKQALLASGHDFGLTPAHLETIFRTNIQTWYAAGRAEQIQRNKDIFPYLRYSAILDARVRPTHAALDGLILPVDHPFWRTYTPPWAFNCFLPGTEILGDAITGLKSFYSGQAVTIKTRMGKWLSVTADHPILTARGWLRAHEVEEGDNLLCDEIEGRQPRSIAGVVNNKQAPTVAKELFDALSTHGLALTRMAAFQLHDDSVGRKSEVDVSSNRAHLRGEKDALGKQCVTKFAFPLPEDAHWLIDRDGRSPANLRVGPLDRVLLEDAVYVRNAHARDAGYAFGAHESAAVADQNIALESVVLGVTRFPRGAELPLDFGPVSLDRGPLHRFGFAPSPDVDAAHAEQAADRLASGSRVFRQLIATGSGKVAVDDVVSVRKYEWAGHVFDFETETGMLFAGGILAHNCRCSVIPMTAKTAQAAIAAAREKGRPVDEVPSDIAAPAAGWDYDRTDPAAPLEGLRKALDRRSSVCVPRQFAIKRKGQPLWCLGPGVELLQRLYYATQYGKRDVAEQLAQRVDILNLAAYATSDTFKNADRWVTVGAFTARASLFEAVGKDALRIDKIELQASYVRHAWTQHGPGGWRLPKHPIEPEDLFRIAEIANTSRLTDTGRLTNGGNRLVQAQLSIDGVRWVVVFEVRPGKRSKSLALFDLYKK